MLCIEQMPVEYAIYSSKGVVEEDDLIPGAEMVWKNKGKLYTVVLQEVDGKHMD